MPYLRSYQMQGDPGIFGSIFGGIKGAVGGFLGGGPLGAIRGGIAGIAGGGRTAAGRAVAARVPMMNQQGPGVRVPVPGVIGFAQRLIPGGATGMQPGGPPPRGMRPNKSGYFLKDGTYVAPGTRYVRIRRRNPANVRALRRALSRAESFGGVVKRARRTTRKLKTL